jgi:hypothetical protein
MFLFFRSPFYVCVRASNTFLWGLWNIVPYVADMLINFIRLFVANMVYLVNTEIMNEMCNQTEIVSLQNRLI